MTDRRVVAALPVAAGLAVLGAGWWLLPGKGEVATAAERAAPVSRAVPPPAPAATPTAAPTSPPSLAALVAEADAATLVAETARLQAAGVAVSTLQVAQDLKAAKRPTVALAYLAARPDGAAPATWRLRIDLLAACGRKGEAERLLADAAEGGRGVAAADLVAAGYALDRPDLLARAAATRAIPAPDATLSLDLARRLAARDRADLIATLDRAGAADWRRADPWLALRFATRAGDRAAAMRAIDLLPADQRDEARASLLERAGDRAALRTLWRERAGRPGADKAAIAERLLAEGFRPDAVAVLRDAAATAPVDAPAAQRLLYLMGPRPAGDDLAWLRARAAKGEEGWVAAYAERDRPAAALAFVAARSASTANALLALRLARAARDGTAVQSALATLLDGRPLDAPTLKAVSALAPSPAPSALVARRIAAGLASPQERLDLAWTAWNRGDVSAAAIALKTYLADRPDDATALRLMADVEAKRGGKPRPWLERALAATPEPGRPRAELLERLGRRAEALRVVEGLRATARDDRGLAAYHARLLIAAGQPGQARAVLAP